MRIFALVLLAAGSAALSSQTPASLPASPDRLLPLPLALSGQSAQFTLQMRATNPPPVSMPKFKFDPPSPSVPSITMQSRTAEPYPQIDRVIVKRPSDLFPIQPTRPAMRQDLFPGLSIQPTELASIALLPTLWPNAKMIPIPTTFPYARFELIPRNIEGLQRLKSVQQAQPRPPETSKPRGSIR